MGMMQFFFCPCNKGKYLVSSLPPRRVHGTRWTERGCQRAQGSPRRGTRGRRRSRLGRALELLRLGRTRRELTWVPGGDALRVASAAEVLLDARDGELCAGQRGRGRANVGRTTMPAWAGGGGGRVSESELGSERAYNRPKACWWLTRVRWVSLSRKGRVVRLVEEITERRAKSRLVVRGDRFEQVPPEGGRTRLLRAQCRGILKE